MGAFGLQFTKNKTVRANSQNKQSQTPKTFVCRDEEANSGFNKALAYISCFSLILVSLCLFLPDQMLRLIQTVLDVVS